MPAAELTFVVVPLVGGDALARCLAAVQRTPAAVVVVGRVDDALARVARQRGAEIVHSEAPVPLRRAEGLAHARTPWIAFCEDTCEIAETWFAAFQALSHDLASDAWGGPIEISPRLSARGAALAALEYGAYRAEVFDGADVRRPAPGIAGLAPLYRAAALPTLAPPQGLIETEVHEALVRSGRPLAWHIGLAVRYQAEDAANATVAARFAHGRIYGGGRRFALPASQRALLALRCLLLPPLLLWRGLAGLPIRRRWDLRALGWLTAFALAWSAGEATGLLFGRGASLAMWR